MGNVHSVASSTSEELELQTMFENSEELVVGHCPDCGPDRRADVIAEHKVESSDDEYGVWGRVTYRILAC